MSTNVRLELQNGLGQGETGYAVDADEKNFIETRFKLELSVARMALTRRAVATPKLGTNYRQG